MSEGSDLGIGQTSEERDDVIHEVLVVDDGVLALLHQQLHKLTEIAPELLPMLSTLDKGVLATLLQGTKGIVMLQVILTPHFGITLPHTIRRRRVREYFHFVFF